MLRSANTSFGEPPLLEQIDRAIDDDLLLSVQPFGGGEQRRPPSEQHEKHGARDCRQPPSEARAR